MKLSCPRAAAPKRRKARRAACAGLAVALAAVGLLVAEILLTNPGRGATPFHIELFLNQRVRFARRARRARPDGNAIRSLETAARSVLSRSIRSPIDRDRLPCDSPSIGRPFRRSTGNCSMPISTDARPLRAGDGSIKTDFSINQGDQRSQALVARFRAQRADLRGLHDAGADG